VSIAILAPAARDLPLAQRLRTALAGEAELIQAPVSHALPVLFRSGRPIIAIAATGVLVRILAPLLGDKASDPPIVAVAADGSCVVPLLGGHRGANRLARRIAQAIDAFAAITTASDGLLQIALDDPPAGWRVRLPPHYAAFMAALLDGAPVRLIDDTGCAGWLRDSTLTFADAAEREIHVTARDLSPTPSRLILLPPLLALGVGAARGAPADELVALAHEALRAAGLAADAVACVVSVDLKADEPAVHTLAQAFSVPARFFSREQLAVEADRVPSPSSAVARAIGIASVAEAAALAAAGPGGRLLVAKRKSPHATVAIAAAAQPIDPQTVGRPRGRLTIVGLGPGDAAYRTGAAAQALARATDLVGYRLYLELIAELAQGRRLHAFALGEEEARCRHALDLAAEGHEVALVCSGDPGIYAMASPVFELLASEGLDRPEWRRIAIEVVPGISAMQLAAARSGAILGHDFCAISLSDLLTPTEVIEGRIEAAAAAGFVIAFYNPVSTKRRTLLARARDILLAHRPAATPVVIARSLARAGEEVRLTTLEQLCTDMVDMLTTVIVGAPTSRSLALPDGRCFVFTPRGYRLP
jgi:cobalt-precorrin 5A hydrolase/precorrin-3B C17-methyltransferase